MTEQQFSEKVVTLLRTGRFFVQSVESHLTSVGIPDLYICDNRIETWLELKVARIPFERVRASGVTTVGWRPGQQGWMWSRYQHAPHRVPCLTLIHYTDGVVGMVPMNKMFIDNRVDITDMVVIPDIRSIPYHISRLVVGG